MYYVRHGTYYLGPTNGVCMFQKRQTPDNTSANLAPVGERLIWITRIG
jgi:hypothetical protein